MTCKINEEEALKALDGDRALFLSLANIFVEDAPGLRDQFLGSVRASNWTAARQAIHSLRGLVASFYAKQDVAFYGQIESWCATQQQESIIASLPALQESLNALLSEVQLIIAR